MNMRKEVLLGSLVLAIAAGWLAKTAAQEGSSSPAATFFEHDKLSADFAKGTPQVIYSGRSGGGEFKLMTATRDRPGEVEIHAEDTDILYVVKGTATFVTGGTAVGSKTTAPGEMRAPSIQNGDPRRVSEGDAIVVPPGVPHWFKEVRAPFYYLAVKVR